MNACVGVVWCGVDDRHVHYDFWSSFCGSAGVFCMGEVFGDDIGYVGPSYPPPPSPKFVPITDFYLTVTVLHPLLPPPTAYRSPSSFRRSAWIKQPCSNLPILNGLRAQLSHVRRAHGGICNSRTGEYDGCDGDVDGVAAADEGVFLSPF